MKGKLGFGLITALKPDVLLIDETLAVGDPPFRNKAMSRLSDMIEKCGTVIISTHSVGFANSNCERGIGLEEGKIIFDGEVKTATALYSGEDNEVKSRLCSGIGLRRIPSALKLIEKGHEVRGLDISERVIQTLANGESPISDGSDRFQYDKNRITASTDYGSLILGSEIIIITVPTPVTEEKARSHALEGIYKICTWQYSKRNLPDSYRRKHGLSGGFQLGY